MIANDNDASYHIKIIDSFNSESSSLKSSIDDILKTSKELSINEIITTYFMVLNTNSHIATLKQYLDNNNSDPTLSNKIKDVESLINEKFNKILHPQILSHLEQSITKSMNHLNKTSAETIKQTKPHEDIENEPNLYDQLRQIMSTKEFVEQYDKTL
jgi:hypothetical protein